VEDPKWLNYLRPARERPEASRNGHQDFTVRTQLVICATVADLRSLDNR